MPPLILGLPRNRYFCIPFNETSGNVTWPEPFAVDNNSTDVDLTSNFQPGDVLPVGDHEIVYTAVDDARNVANASFIISVRPQRKSEVFYL